MDPNPNRPFENLPKEPSKEQPKEPAKPAKPASKSSSKTQPKERLLRGALSTTRDLLQYLDLKISELETDLEVLRGARQVLLKDEQFISAKRIAERGVL